MQHQLGYSSQQINKRTIQIHSNLSQIYMQQSQSQSSQCNVNIKQNNPKSITSKTNNNNNYDLVHNINNLSYITIKRPLTSNPNNNSSLSLHKLRKSNLINILCSKKPQQRTQKQLNLIIQSLKHQTFFISILSNTKLLEQVSFKMEYLLLKQGQIIKMIDLINKQSNSKDSQKCYIIIKGSVDLMIKQDKVIENDNNEYIKNSSHALKQYENRTSLVATNQNNKQKLNEQKDQQNNLQVINLAQQKLKDIIVSQGQFWSPTECNFSVNQYRQQNNNQETSKLDCNNQQHENPIIQSQAHSQELKLLKTYNQGQCFGQFITFPSLITTTNNNHSPIIYMHSNTPTHIITISKQHYQSIILANKANQTKKLIDFLSNLELFKLVYKHSIQEFISSMTEVNYQYKGYLYKQGDNIQNVYIVKNGQFALSKLLNPNHNNNNNNNDHIQNVNPSIDPNDQILSLRRQQHNYRQAQIKNITIGEILSDSQSYLRLQTYTQSCKCTSQTATVYQIPKHKFLQKILSSENQINMIKNYFTLKYQNKNYSISTLIKKHLNNSTIIRMWPPSKSCDRKLKINKSTITSRPSTAIKKVIQTDNNIQPNFFDHFNRTIPKNKQRKRINYKLTLNLSKQKINDSSSQMKKRCKTSMDFTNFSLRDTKTSQTNRQTIKKQIHNTQKTNRKSLLSERDNLEQIPASIKDIVSMVHCKEQYFKTRNKKTQTQINTSFHFQTHKIPRFIQQKYKHLLMRLKAK